MSSIQFQETVGQLVARQPALSRAFEAAGVDYCCGGNKTLEQVCREKGLNLAAFVGQLEQAAQATDEHPPVDAAAMSLTELANHIEQTHHAYLKRELPRLDALTEKVATVHGAKDTRLRDLRATFLQLAGEMAAHMMKEEKILFPIIRQLEASDKLPQFHCGSVANPIQQMEYEHQEAGSALERMRMLTENYTPPDWACNTYRALLDALAYLERDMHQHVHKENNVLFPRAIEREAELA